MILHKIFVGVFFALLVFSTAAKPGRHILSGPTHLRTYGRTDLRTYGPADLQTYGPADRRTTDLRTYGPTDLLFSRCSQQTAISI
jgi:hypothetical protein